MKRKYYEAYDDRYRQIHERNLQWSGENASSIVGEIIRDFSISNHQKILEIGCGEGRDAFPLLRQGFDLLATDVSQEAIRFCRERMPDHAERFQILDCVSGRLNTAFDFIYAIAVVHMLVPDEDRNAFYSFIREHLKPEGIALIGTMGDGSFERISGLPLTSRNASMSRRDKPFRFPVPPAEWSVFRHSTGNWSKTVWL